MPSEHNNCLLHALTYNAAPSDASPPSMDALRQEIVNNCMLHRDSEYMGMKLEAWVEVTAEKSLDEWASDFLTNHTMSDQIVLHLWPLCRGESVWLWKVTETGGYENRRVLRFGESQIVRHVCYRPKTLHYNVLELRDGVSLDGESLG